MPTVQNPKEIHVQPKVASAGRLAALATGKEPGENGENIFSSEGEVQHLVNAGEQIHYVFPLKVMNFGQPKDIAFTFYLFKAPPGEVSDSDIVKIFKAPIETDDDGSCFYETLRPPMNQITK